MRRCGGIIGGLGGAVAEALHGRYNLDSDGMLEAIAELRKNGEF